MRLADCREGLLMRLADCRDLNQLRWSPARRSFFEVYYLRFHDPAQRIAGWFRFVLMSPASRPPEVRVWATLFDFDDPRAAVSINRTFPLGAAQIDGSRQGLTAGGCGFDERTWWGRLETQGSSLAWHFRLEEGEVAFVHLRRPIYGLEFVPMKVLSPFFRARLSGTPVVNGRERRLEAVMANASHYWGHRLIERRAWAICNRFEEDPEFGFEGASGVARLFGVPLPRTTFLCFYRHGEVHLFNSPIRTLLNRSRHDLLRWEFEARGRLLRFRGEARVSDVCHMIAHRYESPDGIDAHDQYIHLDSTADMRIEVIERDRGHWRRTKTLNARRTAAFETSLPAHDPRVAWVVR
jgi:hypothetical protein